MLLKGFILMANCNLMNKLMVSHLNQNETMISDLQDMAIRSDVQQAGVLLLHQRGTQLPHSYINILLCWCELVFWPLKQHRWPTEAVCDLSEAHSRRMMNQRADTRRDALKETRLNKSDLTQAPRCWTPPSPSRDTTRIVSLLTFWFSCGKSDTCRSCCGCGSSHEPPPEKQRSDQTGTTGSWPPGVSVGDLHSFQLTEILFGGAVFFWNKQG